MDRFSKSLADFPGFPVPDQCLRSHTVNRLIDMEMNYGPDDLDCSEDRHSRPLNGEQQIAYDMVLHSVYTNEGKCFFVDGFGGTGKTFLWRAICEQLRFEKKIVLCVASSGIAALLMVGGRTAHSRFHIPLDGDIKSTCNIEQGSEVAELILNASLIIWDEAPMAHKHNIEALDRTLRDIFRVKHVDSELKPFGATCNIEQGSEVAELILNASLIIWDEAPMAHKHNIEALDRTLRDIFRVKHVDSELKPFGGMTIVFGGDFRQTLPIITKGTQTEIVNSSIKRSYLWRSMTVLKLTENMRLKLPHSEASARLAISNFSKWLLEIGDGTNSNIFGESIIPIPLHICVSRRSDPIPDIVAEIYGQLLSTENMSTYLVERAILAPHNDTVAAINNYVLGLFPGEEVSYFSSDSLEIDANNQHVEEGDYTVEFLNSLKIGNFPEHELKLKLGCHVILLRNLDQSTGLCNGTRMIVKRLGKWFIEVQILTGTHVGDTVFLPRLSLSVHYKSLNFTLVRRQYPIALSYAMTINKSQGQTLNHVGICLQRQVFSHGQLYVAMSRVTSERGLKILSCDSQGKPVKTMQNIVFIEIFE
ncbi:unnamed protein product [Linum trigynum]|uniref:ATP-dependent DNA helicase n=1 Tax=Linum trigynum TaxID=586398 RepID=A0AAV2GRW8_9ROSI